MWKGCGCGKGALGPGVARGLRAVAAFCVAMAACCSFWACQKRPLGTVVARVGESAFTLEDIEARIPVYLVGKISSEEKRRLAEGWVEEELLHREALRRGLDEDPEVAVRASRAVRDLLITELLERDFKRDSEVLEGEYHTYYEAHAGDYVRDQLEIRARHILVRSRSELDQVRKRLRQGEPVEQVAREVSLDVSAEEGGDLGYFTEDMVQPAFWAACEKARAGRTVRVETRLGHHVVEVMDRREAGSSRGLLEVRGEIRERILAHRRRERRKALLTQVRERIPWSITSGAFSEGLGE